MKLCPNHFLDTSILLGSRLKWDIQFNYVNNYMGIAEIHKISSKRAHYEAIGVLHRNRRTILQYLDNLRKEFSKPNHLIINESAIYGFSRHYQSSIQNVKIRNALMNFINKHIYEISKALQNGTIVFNNFKQAIRNAFQIGLDSLDLECKPVEGAFIRRYDICPPLYDSVYITEKNRLMQLINYINDVYILLDSHFIRNTESMQELFFVTTDDEHILSNKDSIELILIGLTITHPQIHNKN